MGKIVQIKDIPGDFAVLGMEQYMIPGSIRIVYEGNVGYWKAKFDILALKGEHPGTVTGLELIATALAKDPEFYETLPQELKEYIHPGIDEDDGHIVMDRENRIKRLLLTPVRKSNVDIRYLEQLDRINKELETMV